MYVLLCLENTITQNPNYRQEHHMWSINVDCMVYDMTTSTL